jgi:branched-chain amino acid transport system permease protein
VFYGFVIATALIAAVLLAFRFWRGGVALRATASDQAGGVLDGHQRAARVLARLGGRGDDRGVAGIVVGSIGGISSRWAFSVCPCWWW